MLKYLLNNILKSMLEYDLELRIKENKDKIKRGEAEIQQGKYTTINVTQGQIDAGLSTVGSAAGTYAGGIG